MSLDNSSDERDPVEKLAEEFVARHRRGERPSASDYAEQFPQWAERIHSLFPALLLMEQHKPGLGDVTDGALDPGGKHAPLDRLGDYRIIREVGRGGMAVVYEAEQESLGRHVALKVLLTHTRLDPRQSARFQREARAAARLHHTNIVPVYGVGEQDGVHYYVMQFIPGQGLDEVLREVQRLRRLGASATNDQPSFYSAPENFGPATATDVARELMSGHFGPLDLKQFDVHDPTTSTPSPSLTNRIVAEPLPRAADSKGSDIHSLTPVESVSSSIRGPGPHETSSLSGPLRHYWRGVAWIAVQVAEALQYSHGQGVLHRDIKPSNLLLDLHGTVWVADFGLAKLADQVDLTHPGDVVGTWRYMAPERFRGESDPRSDVYSLGLTLYELLVLRPAFDGSTREELIKQVSFGVPPRPRKLNPELPRDLETIVLKAIERDPNQRYQSAGEFAEDLRRFLEDRPTRARRCGPGERAWRWARRNPAVSSLAASVIVLLVMLAIGSTFAAVWLNNGRNQALAHLWGAYIAQARAERSSHQAGQRFTSLDVLAKAAKIKITSEVRNEAIAALALVDVRHVRDLATIEHEDDGFTIDRALKLYAIGDSRGNVTVRSVEDGSEIAQLPPGPGPCRTLEFSPQSRYLWAAYMGRQHWSHVLWDVQVKGKPRKVTERTDDSYHFSPDDREFAAQTSEKVVEIFDTSTGESKRKYTIPSLHTLLHFHPHGRHLAIRGPTARTIRLIDLETEQDVWSHTYDVDVGGVYWSGDGRLVSIGGADDLIYVVNVSENRLQSVLDGHLNTVVHQQFSSSGSYLFSSSWDGSMRVWDPVRGKQILTTSAQLIMIGPDDRQIALREHGKVFGLWELAIGRECRSLHHGMVGNRTPRPPGWGPSSVDYSADGQFLTSADRDGIEVWDPYRAVSIGRLPLFVVRFSPDGKNLLGLSNFGDSARLWPLATESGEAGRVLHIGPPRAIGPDRQSLLAHGTWDKASRYVVVKDAPREQAVVFDVARATEVARFGPHPLVNQLPISPDGRFVATATWKGHDVKVWDVSTGQVVKEWKCDSAFVAFSPDGKWLAYSPFPGLECRLFHVGTWEPGPAVHLSNFFFGAMAFTQDGSLFAIDDSGHIRLVDPADGRDLATLDSGTGSSSNFYCMQFSPDGTQLAAGRDHIIHLWDLRLIRKGLAAIGLDWDAPAYPPAQPNAIAEKVVLVGESPANQKKDDSTPPSLSDPASAESHPE